MCRFMQFCQSWWGCWPAARASIAQAVAAFAILPSVFPRAFRRVFSLGFPLAFAFPFAFAFASLPVAGAEQLRR